MKTKIKKPIIIAGPCAVESKGQILESAIQAKKRNVDYLRTSLWKPRTKPGFDGLKEEGIELLAMVAKMGVNPATEVITPNQAKMVIDAVLGASSDSQVLVWIGARNQNHYIQQEIAGVVGNNPRVKLAVKNQPWTSEEHWDGIIEHVLAGGVSKDNLIICHRGFCPSGKNPLGFRNIPDYKMSLRMKKKWGLPMIIDPSHMGGSVDNVLKIAKQFRGHDFDGMIIEVHPNPQTALTDAKQQLTWQQLDTLLDCDQVKKKKISKRFSDPQFFSASNN